MNRIGETLVDFKYRLSSNAFLVTEEGLLLREHNDNEDEIKFGIFKLKDMKRNLIILLVIPILLISCGSDNYKDFMQNTLSENFKNTMCSFKAIVIIPNQGCAGCISESEGFLKCTIQN